MKLLSLLLRSQFWILLILSAFFSLKSNPGEVFESVWDKLLHFTCYFVIYLSLNISIKPNKHLLIKGAFLLIYSVGIEIGQHYMPNRFFSPNDIFANAVGIVSGIIISLIMLKYLKKLAK